MMLPPGDDLGGSDRRADVPAYDRPRGACPRCGSSEVRHLLVGMLPGPPEELGLPGWVHPVGCVVPAHDRSCDTCGHDWLSVGRRTQ